jgi:ribulose-5-phosphate 4-epimerase/fuculose-1-phosphate aldolase
MIDGLAVAVAGPARVTPVVIFGRLFESELLTLEGFAISCRAPGGMHYLDQTNALASMLAQEPPGDLVTPSDPTSHALHRAMYEAWPDVEAVVSGVSLHLRALMDEGMALPAPTSMMIKRGVTDLQDHLVGPEALVAPHLDATLARARAAADGHGMRHVLLVTTAGTVCVAGPSPEETMAHYSNVEFSARVECLRIEEATVHGPGG